MNKSHIIIIAIVAALVAVGAWILSRRLHLGMRAPHVPLVKLDSTFHSPAGPRPIEFDYFSAPFDTLITARLNDSLPAWAFKISVISDSTDRWRPTRCCVQVLQLPDSLVLQKFADKLELRGGTRLRFIDVDFDGTLDLELLEGSDAVGNESRHFWLFDRKSRQFHLNSEFSERLGGDLVADPDKKELYTGFPSIFGGDSYTYRVTDGRLLLIEHTGSESVTADDTGKIRHFVKRLVDGKMKVVEESFEVR